MIGSVILCALLAALFWAAITGRLRLPEEPEEERLVVGFDFTPTGGSAVLARPLGGGSFTVLGYVRSGLDRPFDWSEHPDL